MRLLALPALIGAAFLSLPLPSHAFMDFFQKDMDNAPDDAELRRQESLAQALVSKAEAEEASDPDEARDIYRSVVKKYSLTTSAALSQYKVGYLYARDGKHLKAFEAYQHFIENYKHSSAFAAAVEAQYKITRSGHDGEFKDSFIGIPRKLQPSELLEMYGKIIRNAPYSRFAPLSQFAIGEVYQKDKKAELAIASYQKVVDDYPRSPQAPIAQVRIGEIGMESLARGSEDQGKVKKAEQALGDMQILFPNHELAHKAQEGIARLKAGSAKRLFDTARFYEKQGKPHSARIYYQQVADSGDPEFAGKAQAKLNELPDTPHTTPDPLAGMQGTEKKGFRLPVPKLPRLPFIGKKDESEPVSEFPNSQSTEGRDLVDNEIDGVDWAAMDREMRKNMGRDMPPEPRPVGDEQEREERRRFGIPRIAFWKKEDREAGSAPVATAPKPERGPEETKKEEKESRLKKLAFWKKDDKPGSGDMAEASAAPSATPDVAEEKKPKKKLLRMPKLPSFRKDKDKQEIAKAPPKLVPNRNPTAPPAQPKRRKLKNQPQYVGPPAPRKSTANVAMRTSNSVPFTGDSGSQAGDAGTDEVTATIPDDPKKLLVPPPPEE